jgi:hypothetical protein
MTPKLWLTNTVIADYLRGPPGQRVVVGIGHAAGSAAIRWAHDLTYDHDSKSDVDRICQSRPKMSASVCSTSTVEPATTGMHAPRSFPLGTALQ